MRSEGGVRELGGKDGDRLNLRGLLLAGATSAPATPVDPVYFEGLRERVLLSLDDTKFREFSALLLAPVQTNEGAGTLARRHGALTCRRVTLDAVQARSCFDRLSTNGVGVE